MSNTSVWCDKSTAERIAEIAQFLAEQGQSEYAAFVQTLSPESKTDTVSKIDTNTELSKSIMEEAVVTYLHTQTAAVPTLQLARHINGLAATRKTINPVLYKLEREGKIHKTANPDGTDPRWSVCTNIVTLKNNAQ